MAFNNPYSDVFPPAASNVLPDNSVTLAKLQQIPANTVLANATDAEANTATVALAVNQLLGRGAGNIAPVALGTNLSITDNVLNAAGGGGAGIASINQIIYTGSDTYTKPANLLYLFIEVIGSGGGGGGSPGGVSGAAVAGGGASGAYASSFLAAADVGATEAVSIGAAGSGGAAGANDGNDADGSSFGDLVTTITAFGGKAGTNSAGFAFAQGGTAFGGTGQIVGSGQYGESGIADGVTQVGRGGNGAPSFFGGGGRGAFSEGNGNGSATPGGGGGGALSFTSDEMGGDGALGLIRVTEFLSA